MELAILPRLAGEDRLANGVQAGVLVTHDQLHAVESSIDRRLEEFAPMNLAFAERVAETEDRTLAVGQPADRGQGNGSDDRSAATDLLVAGIEDQVGDLTERLLTPSPEFRVQLGGGAAYLGAGNLQATQLPEEVGDTRGRDALDVHRLPSYSGLLAPVRVGLSRPAEFASFVLVKSGPVSRQLVQMCASLHSFTARSLRKPLDLCRDGCIETT